MPKVIENLALRLSEEARRQVAENGYAALTIRSVAKACGVGVGTVYNYYPSKEALAASYMLRDWNNSYANLMAQCKKAEGPAAIVRSIYDMLLHSVQSTLHSFMTIAQRAAFLRFLRCITADCEKNWQDLCGNYAQMILLPYLQQSPC